MPERVVLFDFDGTLGWIDGGWVGSFLGLMRERGLADGVTLEQARPGFSEGFRWQRPKQAHPMIIRAEEWWGEVEPIFERMALRLGAPEDVAGELSRAFRGRYLEPERWRLFPEVVPCLAALKEDGWILEIASNHVPELALIVDHLGISGSFRKIHSSAWMGYEKPNPNFYGAITRNLSQDARVWMVGDSLEADYLGARQAGLDSILVRKASPEADRFLVDLTGLPSYLARS